MDKYWFVNMIKWLVNHIWANPVKSTLDLEIVVLQTFFIKISKKKLKNERKKSAKHYITLFCVTSRPFPKILKISVYILIDH